jgi:hypothetical protein
MTTCIANSQMNFERNAPGSFHGLNAALKCFSTRKAYEVQEWAKMHSLIRWAPKIDKFSGIRKMPE